MINTCVFSFKSIFAREESLLPPLPPNLLYLVCRTVYMMAQQDGAVDLCWWGEGMQEKERCAKEGVQSSNLKSMTY